MDWRTAARVAMIAAARVHRSRDIDLTKWVDVFGLLADIDVTLAFRPLGRLDAAALNLDARTRGVIVNSGRPLQRQRYSAAHELGHLEFNHETALDIDALIERAPAARWTDDEKLAESFAAWFLMPHSLLRHSLKRLGIERLTDPAEVYQLALRMGTSYESTARHLVAAQMCSFQRSAMWLKSQPADIKRKAAGKFLPEVMRNDVHILTRFDHGNAQLVRSGDRIIIHLDEKPTSGYRWHVNVETLPRYLTILDDSYVQNAHYAADDAYATGGLEKRQLVLAVGEPDEVRMLNFTMEERRAWEPTSIATASFELTVETAERLGVPARYFAAA